MGDLTRAWLLLLAFTAAAMLAGTMQIGLLPPAVQIAIVVLVGGLKGWTILDRYLGLRAGSAGWRALFAILIIVLCGGLLVTYEYGCRQGGNACVGRTAGSQG